MSNRREWIPIVGGTKSGTLIESDEPFSITIYDTTDGRTEQIQSSFTGQQHIAIVDLPVTTIACMEVLS